MKKRSSARDVAQGINTLRELSPPKVAPWAPKGVEFRVGSDVGGHGWCMLCGQDAPVGVVMDTLGKATLSSGDIAYICFSCARRIGELGRAS